MGHIYDQIWVQHAGFLAFQNETRFTINNDWPHPNYPHVDDPIFIAPFYCRIELLNDRYLTGEPELDFYQDYDYGRVMYRYVMRPPAGFIMPDADKVNAGLQGDEKLHYYANKLLDMAQVILFLSDCALGF